MNFSWHLRLSRWTGPKFGFTDFFPFYSGPEEEAKKLFLEYCRTLKVASKLQLLDEYDFLQLQVETGAGAEVDMRKVEESLNAVC